MEEQAEDLRVSGGRPAGDEIEKQKHEQAADEAAEKIEGGGAETHGEEKELSFRAQNGERA